MTTSYVSYIRVSTSEQEKSGLGLESQTNAIRSFVENKGIIIDEKIEIESGKNNDRPKLNEAIELCQATGATLVIAKLDRLSRNAAFLIKLRDSKLNFVCCDMPEADRFMIGLMALLAERERELISNRTKAALAIRKAQGVLMGGAAHDKGGFTPEIRAKALAARRATADNYNRTMGRIIAELKTTGLTRTEIVNHLKQKHYMTPQNKPGGWTMTLLRRVEIAYQKLKYR